MLVRRCSISFLGYPAGFDIAFGPAGGISDSAVSKLPQTAMIKTFPPTGPNSPQSSGWRDTDRLDSWKKIATHLRRKVPTVQLCGTKEALPSHLHFHNALA